MHRQRPENEERRFAYLVVEDERIGQHGKAGVASAHRGITGNLLKVSSLKNFHILLSYLFFLIRGHIWLGV